MAIKYFLGSILACLMVLPALASDYTVPQSTLYPYQSLWALQDDFLSGTTTAGSVGTLGWGVSGGTTTNQASVANRPGLLRRDTSAVINTLASLTLNTNTSAAFAGNLPHVLTFIERLNTNDADTEIRIGAGTPTGLNPPADGIYFEKLGADTNYFCVTRAGNVQTRTDTGVAVNITFNTFMYARSATDVQFYLNGALVCTHTANLTTATFSPFTQIITLAAAAKTHDHDYFQIKVIGYTR